VSEPGISEAVGRVGYDLDLAARTIIASHLPGEFADFLRTGG